ncbi:MAG: nickel-dependent hydrogenase large subunit [Gammaproteobacteria bacterium]
MAIPLAAIEGYLRIHVRLAATGSAQVSLRAGRPLPVARVLVGQPVQEALRRINRLYSVCAMAQGTAAAEACEEALGVEVSPQQKAARRLLVEVETAQEHLWRILVDWPRRLRAGGVEAAPLTPLRLPGWVSAYQAALYREVGPPQCGGGRLAFQNGTLQALSRQFEALLAGAVFGMDPSAWSRLAGEAALASWSAGGRTPAAQLVQWVLDRGWEQFGRSAVLPLPALSATSLHAKLSSDEAEDFAACPTWGTCRETTPLTRNQDHLLVAELMGRYGNGLLPRLVAALVELADVPKRVRQVTALLRSESGVAGHGKGSVSGLGLSQIEAARGRLIHRVGVTGDRISMYQIVAPTAWNFHPSGVAIQGLRTLDGAPSDGVEAQAALLIEAIDPCMRYHLTIHHAR